MGQSCLLGNPDAKAWPGRPAGIAGRFDTEGRVIFDGRPKNPWDFLATGTGVTGITVTVDRNLRLQVNHSSSFDEMAMQRTLGVLRIEWGYVGYTQRDFGPKPVACPDVFKMEHDLRRSLITITSESKDGPVRAEIRAHVTLDVIRIDLFDERKSPQPLAIYLEKDYPHEDDIDEDGNYLSWHTNRSSVYEKANAWCGFSMDEGSDFLLGRSFGTAMRVDSASAEQVWSSGHFSGGASRHYTLWIAGGSTLEGEAVFRKIVTERLSRARSMEGNSFIETHEAWWHDFWQRSYFEPGDPAGRFVRHRATFELYRYYVACSSSDAREVPVRFQNDLFRYNTSQGAWSVMDITSVETYQAIFGASRTGDFAALRSRVSFYQKALELFRRHSRARFSHGGAVCPYEHTVWGSYLFWEGKPTDYTEAESFYLRYSWSGNLWMLLLMCDYVELTGDDDFAEGGLYPFAEDVMTFFAEHYPARENGRIVFEPSETGETWCNIKNSAELVSAMHAVLPRLIALGRRRNWQEKSLKKWQEMFESLPPLPRGRLEMYPIDPSDPLVEAGRILPGDLLVPAEDLSRADPPFRINRQHTELYSVWPARLMLGSPADRDVAVRSYHARHWKHLTDGWNLDVVFAACLGLDEEVEKWFEYHFDATHTFPCGLAQESSPKQPDCEAISIMPSMQGLGTSVIAVLEMLLQDYPDKLVVLPCWPIDVPVRFALYSPFAGRVEVSYKPNDSLEVTTERQIMVELRPAWRERVRLVTECRA